MKFIRKALWPTAIVAAFLMLFGALGSATNADTVKGSIQTEDGGVVYVEVEVDSLLANAQAARDAVKAADDSAKAILATARTLTAGGVDAALVTLRAAIKELNDAIDLLNESEEALARNEDAVDDLAAYAPSDSATGGTGAITATSVLTDAGTLATRSAEVLVVAEGDATSDTTRGLAYAKTLPGSDLDDYTVEIDGGSGDASIVKTLKKGDGGNDGDANVVSNRARDSRTVTPVLVSDEADQEELEDYNVDADIGSYYVLVVVACDEFGSYNISFTNDNDANDVVDANLECATDVDTAVLSASVSTIFTTSNKLTSEITVTLEDEDGDAATPGDTVRFKTDNCEFEGSGKSSDSEESETVKGDTTAGVTLDCSGAGAGTATVSASVDRPGSDVYAENIVITLVGPPADLTLTVAVSMDNMVCGNPRKIDITDVVDTNGETVADGTSVIVSTNYGGVLTGATTGRFAPSSTAVVTTDGAASVYLITSDTQVGDYAVLASAGSAVAHLTIACMAEMMDADAAAAITPPSTGNAGLAETSGSSWMLLAIAGVLASVMVAVGKGMPSFFRR